MPRRDALTAPQVLIAPLVLLWACHEPGVPEPSFGEEPLFRVALVERGTVERAVRLEALLEQTYHERPPPDGAWFKALRGARPVLFVAGHATAHPRAGRLKQPDKGTGSLAIMLHDVAGAHALYTTHQSPRDPNYAEDSLFKQAVLDLVAEVRPQLVIDVHAADGARPFDLDFGTMHGASLKGRSDLLEQLAAAMRHEGLRNFSQDYFAAARQSTITRHVAQNTDVPCLQLEINETYLLTSSSGDLEKHRFAQLLQGLARFVKSFEP